MKIIMQTFLSFNVLKLELTFLNEKLQTFQRALLPLVYTVIRLGSYPLKFV